MSNDDNRNPYPEDKIINTESTSNNQNMNNNNQPFNMVQCDSWNCLLHSFNGRSE